MHGENAIPVSQCFVTNAGMFTMDRERCNVPCLFYATLNNKICVHYNVRLKQIGISNLFEAVEQLCSAAGIECPTRGIAVSLCHFSVRILYISMLLLTTLSFRLHPLARTASGP